MGIWFISNEPNKSSVYRLCLEMDRVQYCVKCRPTSYTCLIWIHCSRSFSIIAATTGAAPSSVLVLMSARAPAEPSCWHFDELKKWSESCENSKGQERNEIKFDFKSGALCSLCYSSG